MEAHEPPAVPYPIPPGSEVEPPGVPPIPPGSEPIEEEEAYEVGQNGDVPADLLATLSEARKEAQPFGKTKLIEVPGYHGLLAIEYQYIGSEITEAIARKVRRETRSVDGQGSGLLASIDTLRAACKRVLCRRSADEKEWISVGGKSKPVVRLDTTLSRLLNYDADDGREVVLGLFGSEHAINQQNLIVSQWLADKSRTSDEDFLV